MKQIAMTMPSSARLLFPGLVSAITVALAARFLSDHYGAPVMLMALLLGMAFTFLAEPGTSTAIGAGVILSRLCGRSLPFGLLTGGAVAICGASAALAISSVLPKGDANHERDTIFTVIAVTALSTLAMIVYPMIGVALGMSEHAMGVFFGATIHDVAQVVGAGYSVSDDTGATATFVKLLRVALLVPVVVTISLMFGKARAPGQSLPIPFFVIGFAALVLIGSAKIIPPEVTGLLLELSRWCLVTAIAALGMKTSLKKLGEVGGVAIGIVCGLTVLLAVFALVSIHLLNV